MGAPARSGSVSHAARGLAAYSAAARSHLKVFARNESGATAIEYALLATIITVGIISALTMIGSTLAETFQSVKSGFSP
jgi:pilus assembly protein Flp/PilA